MNIYDYVKSFLKFLPHVNLREYNNNYFSTIDNSMLIVKLGLCVYAFIGEAKEKYSKIITEHTYPYNSFLMEDFIYDCIFVIENSDIHKFHVFHDRNNYMFIKGDYLKVHDGKTKVKEFEIPSTLDEWFNVSMLVPQIVNFDELLNIREIINSVYSGYYHFELYKDTFNLELKNQ